MSHAGQQVCRVGRSYMVPVCGGPAGWRWLGLIAAVTVLGFGCAHDDGGSSAGAPIGGSALTTVVPETVPVSPAATDAPEPSVRVVLHPGEGVEVSLGVGVRSGDVFRAEVLKLLLGELGFAASEPAELVTRANLAYLYLAEGEFDVWVGAWMPADLAWLEGERFDGSTVGASVSILGGGSPAVGVFGWLISKAFADEYGVFTLDDLNSDPAALAAIDAVDAVPGNGKAEILSWPELGTADQIVASQIAHSGWDNIAQFNVGYLERYEMATDAAARGVPMVVAAGEPSRLVAQLHPGVEVYWLGVEDFLDDSNPLGLHEGALFSQATRGVGGTGGNAPLSAEICPAASQQPLGLCPLGWDAGELRIAANVGFAAANPAAAALLDAVVVPTADISQALAREADGSDPAGLAAAWVAANRVLVDEWLAAARAAASRG